MTMKEKGKVRKSFYLKKLYDDMDEKDKVRKCMLPPCVIEGVDNLLCCMDLYMIITWVSLNNLTSL